MSAFSEPFWLQIKCKCTVSRCCGAWLLSGWQKVEQARIEALRFRFASESPIPRTPFPSPCCSAFCFFAQKQLLFPQKETSQQLYNSHIKKKRCRAVTFREDPIGKYLTIYAACLAVISFRGPNLLVTVLYWCVCCDAFEWHSVGVIVIHSDNIIHRTVHSYHAVLCLICWSNRPYLCHSKEFLRSYTAWY